MPLSLRHYLSVKPTTLLTCAISQELFGIDCLLICHCSLMLRSSMLKAVLPMPGGQRWYLTINLPRHHTIRMRTLACLQLQLLILQWDLSWRHSILESQSVCSTFMTKTEAFTAVRPTKST